MRRDAGGKKAGNDKESGVGDHAVFRAHGKAIKVPLAAHIFPRNGIGETLGCTQILDETRHLRHGRNVAHEDTARDKGVRDGLNVLPGCQHIEHDAVNAASFSRP